MNLQKIKDSLLNANRPLWVGLIFAILVIANIISSHLKSKQEIPNATANQDSPPDTFVPQGYVLAPLELTNSGNLEGISGSYAIVDLYSTGPKRTLLAKHIKMIRSPTNILQYAALVHEDQTSLIQALSEPVFAVFKNPNRAESFETPPKSQRPQTSSFRHIRYGDQF